MTLMLMPVWRGGGRVAGKRVVERAAQTVPAPAFDLVMLLGFGEG